MRDVQYPLEGACQCGGVTYELLAAPMKVMACHCRECQKLSTSPFSVTAVVRREDIVFHGEMKYWERLSDSGNTNGAWFCPTCGNRMYHVNPAQPEIIKLKPGTLSDTRMLAPQAHVWVSEKQDWFVIPDGVPQFDRQP